MSPVSDTLSALPAVFSLLFSERAKILGCPEYKYYFIKHGVHPSEDAFVLTVAIWDGIGNPYGRLADVSVSGKALYLHYKDKGMLVALLDKLAEEAVEKLHDANPDLFKEWEQ